MDHKPQSQHYKASRRKFKVIYLWPWQGKCFLEHKCPDHKNNNIKLTSPNIKQPSHQMTLKKLKMVTTYWKTTFAIHV